MSSQRTTPRFYSSPAAAENGLLDRREFLRGGVAAAAACTPKNVQGATDREARAA